LNALQNSIKILSNAKSPVIITPHPGEMARLLNPKSEAGSNQAEIRTKIEKERINTAVSFSQETGVYVVLKGVPTIVAAPEGDVYINTTGNPGMATAGSGDVLTGIISSLAGQGLNPFNAAVLGVYLHGRAGDEAAKVRGEHSLIASDIIEYLSDTIRCMA
jgi:ADP-dependent NAD(P)H-hydrate dehydratase / NAD(P)H-hydrate epimerase